MPAGMKAFAAFVGVTALGITALAVWSAIRSVVFLMWLVAALVARGGAT